MKSFDRRSTALIALPILLLAALAIVRFAGSSEADFRKRIGEAEKDRRWPEASQLWDGFEARFPDRLVAADFVRRARCELVLDHPTKAQALLNRWKRLDDRDPEGWQLAVELRRALGDTDGVNHLVREALREAAMRRSPGFLSVSTFGLLTVMDPEESRARLQRWEKAEPDSPLAKIWLLQKSLDEVDATGQELAETLAQVRILSRTWPDDPEIRRVLVETLFLQGDYEEIRQEMARWPDDGSRDSVGWLRLEGRRLLEIENQPRSAVPLFEAVIARMPQDWRSRYRLSRALAGCGRAEEARREANRTVEIRELLEPASLERVLKDAFPKGKSPNPAGLIALLRRIDQADLAQAWQEWLEAEKLISNLR